MKQSRLVNIVPSPELEAWLIWPPKPHGFRAVLLDPGQPKQPARDSGRTLHPADAWLEQRLRPPVLGMRPANTRLVGRAPVQNVLRQVLDGPAQPLPF